MVERRATVHGLPSHEQIVVQLQRLLQDQRFSHSESLSRFLRFAVEETLQGRAAGLKEQVLGGEVFGRGSDFDPRIDTIVRVQAAKLRTRLESYYQAEGALDEVVIELPKGGYTPAFRRRIPSAQSTPKARSHLNLGWAGIGILLIVAAVVGWWRFQHVPSAAPLAPPVRLTADVGVNIFPAVSRDGRIVVFSSDRAGGHDLDLWMIPPGGKPVQLTDDPGPDITPDISPDGSWVVYRSNREQGGLYLVSILGREERRLTDGGWRPRFSPDGTAIAFQGASSRPGGDLFVIPSMGGPSRRVDIANMVQLGGVPLWTPDGSHLIFIGIGPNGNLDWWVVPVNGGVAVPMGLAEQLRAQAAGDFTIETVPGDWLGQDVLFALVGDGRANLWRVPVSTKSWKISGPARQITSGSALELCPRISAAGRIVFSSDTRLTHLWGLVPGRPEATLEQLTNDSSLPPGHFRGPAIFSAGPRLLAFSTHRAGNPDIFLRELSSGKEWALTSGPEAEEDPLLAPDEKSIAYVVRSGSRRSIRIVDLKTRLSREICADCGRPYSWLPDGRSLLAGRVGAGGTSLDLVDVSTGVAARWIEDRETSILFASPSPDGRALALAARSPGASELRLYVAKLEDGKPVGRNRWAPLPAVEPGASLGWSAAGDRVYFFSESDGRRCLWSSRWDGNRLGQAQPVRHFHDQRRYPWNTWVSSSPHRLVFALTESTSNIWSIEPSSGGPTRLGFSS